jgi:pilus assembly protein Flp/PilA
MCVSRQHARPGEESITGVRGSPSLKERTAEMLQQSWSLMRRVLKDEQGAAAIEYGLLAALVGVALFAGAQALGVSLDGLFTDISTFLTGVSPIGGGGTP